jgi:hypothetical protein
LEDPVKRYFKDHLQVNEKKLAILEKKRKMNPDLFCGGKLPLPFPGRH